VVTMDAELETWRKEWRKQTVPLPELKKKIRRQNQRTALAVVAVCLCLAFATVAASRNHSWFMAGLASGIGFSGLVMGAYAWWVRRGSWKPSAQTTLAYAELSYKRAIAKARILRFAFYFLLIAIVLFAGFVAWNWRHFRARDGVIVAAMAVEAAFIRRQELRKKRETEETGKLVDGLQES
jgi:Flp pilus assembly protein TadB